MRILHTADTHIGARQYGLEERRSDFSRAFEQVIDIAIGEELDAVVHAGDLFDDRYPSAEDLHETFQTLSRLSETGIPFLGVVGNHEQRRGVQWLDLFARLGLAVHLSAVPYEVGGVRFVGMDYSGRREVEVPELDGGVLVCHQMIDRVRSDGELRLADLARSGAGYVLLGDWHEHEIWREGEILVTYPGSTERWSLNEREPRGVSLIELDSGRLDRRTLTTRRFLYIGEDEDPIKGIDARRERLNDAIVCVYLGRDGHRIGEIEERARLGGALAVRVVDRREDAEAEARPVQVDLEMGNIDALVSDRLDELELAPMTRRIDEVIRDPHIADSNVDAEVTKLLEALSESAE